MSLSTAGLKTWVRSNPVLYDLIQSIKDRQLLRAGQQAGSFSQHGEDKIILQLLQEAQARGPFVDIGSNHPFKYNNTYLLHQHGWRGVCVDPLPRFAPLYRKWRKEDVFVCVAVGEAEGEIPFYEFEWDMLSTLDGTLAESYQQAGHRLLRRSVVPARPIGRILEQHLGSAGQPVSLLSLDVEGFELTALRTIDLERWQPQFVCLEVQTADGTFDTAAMEYLSARGYQVARNLGLNVILQRAASPAGA